MHCWPKGVQILADRGEAGQEMVGAWHVVESDDGHILRDPDPIVMHGPDEAQRHQVVRHENR